MERRIGGVNSTTKPERLQMLLCLTKINFNILIFRYHCPFRFACFSFECKFCLWKSFYCALHSPVRNVQFSCSLVPLHWLSFISTQENSLASLLNYYYICISQTSTDVLFLVVCSDFWGQLGPVTSYVYCSLARLFSLYLPGKATLHTHEDSVLVLFIIQFVILHPKGH